MRNIFAIVWFTVGCGLGYLGLSLIASANPEQASLLIALSLIAGLLKGRFVIAKVGRRAAMRIAKGGPFYSLREIVLVVTMMSVGMAMRALDVSPLVRGPILIGVGAALFVGAIATLRAPICDRQTP